MSIPYQPRAGDVLRCDFHGMIAPEMVKLRDIVVLMPNPQNRKLVTVVPLSATAPEHSQPYHHELSKNPRPDSDFMKSIWAKCDMLYTVSTDRLFAHYTRTRRGGRQSVRIRLPATDFTEIRRCVAIALGFHDN